MNRILTMFLLMTAIVTWTMETMNRDRLTKRLDQARLAVRALPRVKAENADLARQQPLIGERESLRRDRGELATLRRELAHREKSGEAMEAALSAVGQDILPFMLWLPTSSMSPIGRVTPHAALQTFLAAANARDHALLKNLLVIEPGHEPPGETADSAKTHAAEWVAKRAPFGEVQVMAERLKGFDEAVEFLAVRGPDGQVTAIPLRLRWEQDGWRVIAPTGVPLRDTSAGRSNSPVNPLQNAPILPEP